MASNNNHNQQRGFRNSGNQKPAANAQAGRKSPKGQGYQNPLPGVYNTKRVKELVHADEIRKALNLYPDHLNAVRETHYQGKGKAPILGYNFVGDGPNDWVEGTQAQLRFLAIDQEIKLSQDRNRARQRYGKEFDQLSADEKRGVKLTQAQWKALPLEKRPMDNQRVSEKQKASHGDQPVELKLPTFLIPKGDKRPRKHDTWPYAKIKSRLHEIYTEASALEILERLHDKGTLPLKVSRTMSEESKEGDAGNQSASKIEYVRSASRTPERKAPNKTDQVALGSPAQSEGRGVSFGASKPTESTMDSQAGSQTAPAKQAQKKGN